MGRFPLSDSMVTSDSLNVLSDAPAAPVPEAPKPVVSGPADGLSCVLRDVRDSVTQHEGLVGRAVEVLKTCFDPEIPVNIYELGLIYEVREQPEGGIHVIMTLTSP